MKLAVTYDNGQVFQHFGRTEFFKVYEIENGEILSTEVIDSNGQGHEALAYVLADKGVALLICGGIGGGAQAALADAGVVVCSGASGDCDEAVAAFLRGELIDAGTTCDHHDHEEGHDCGGHCGGGCHDEGGCGGGCGGCGCGFGEMSVIYEGPNAGHVVKVHYIGTFNDGEKFDSSYDRGETLEFVCGVGMMIPGFDKTVVNMNVGDKTNIHLMPEEAYGMPDPNAILTFEIEKLPGSEGLNVGERVVLQDMYGNPIPVVVVAKDETTITLDANSEMAGKELNFFIELVEVQ